MRIQQFLDHHGVTRNPFAEEDAQTDPVFKNHCIESTYHPAWDKVYGDPREPATSVVFGEKGAGKTALRLQLAEHLDRFNNKHPERRLLVVHYDDFNAFLDRFKDACGYSLPDDVLEEWKLWDHMDAILSIAVGDVVTRILDDRQPADSTAGDVREEDVDQLNRHEARDLLLLAACYDRTSGEPFLERWQRLRRRLGFGSWTAWRELGIGAAATLGVLLLAALLIWLQVWSWGIPFGICAALLLAGWSPWLYRFWNVFWQAWGVANNVRVLTHEQSLVRDALLNFTSDELANQPLPVKQSTDDRYAMLEKLLAILKRLGFHGIIVMVDRVDEPHLTGGSAQLMKSFVWPLLDNKFLKQPGLGLKMLLPIEIKRFIQKEDELFYQRARLDKQNVIPSLEWTGEALYDVANDRIKACSDGGSASLREFLDPAIGDQRLLGALRDLRVPRHMFKFLYRLLTQHCNAYTGKDPRWTISSEMFESVLAVYTREQDAAERGVGAG